MISIDKVHTETQIAHVARLAQTIWLEHYMPLIGRAQVDYMLVKFQNQNAIAQQIADRYDYYLALQNAEPVGYFAVVLDCSSNSLMLSKLYVERSVRSQGVGRVMLAAAEELARQQSLRIIWLTVNKGNQTSITWYTHMGFKNARPIVQDIGGGLIMDDYRMEKSIDKC